MSTAITDITGIGPSIAKTLAENGFHTAEDIAVTDVDTLCTIPGIGPVKAKATIAAAAAMVTFDAIEPEPTIAEKTKEAAIPSEEKPAKAKSKKKNKKKSKPEKSSKKKKSEKSKKAKKSKAKGKKSSKKKKKK
tara:strand:- start:109 stop:510 length:402 start_codon:yes stop_codon:yes gene_type:complete